MPSRIDMLAGRRASAAYLLRDMARDTVGLMDHLGIDAAHLVGASMGGMIAQQVAIEFPERSRSLVSIMSTTGSRWTGAAELQGLRRPARHAAGQPRRGDRARGQDLPRDRLARLPLRRGAWCASYAGRSYDRGHSSAGVARQLHAIMASGDRTKALHRLDLPATVIHGDSDHLVRPAGGRATAKAIPGARLRMIEGMGHDLPRPLWPEFAEEIAATAERADEPAPQPA